MNSTTETDIRKHILAEYAPVMAQTLLRLRKEMLEGSDRARVMLSDLLRFSAP